MSGRTLLIAGALLISTIGRPALATMLIVVYTADGYWIGADSSRSTGDGRHETVCKVHETKFGLLLKSGAIQGTTTDGQLYSTDKEVEDTIAESASSEEFKDTLESRLKSDIQAELVYVLNNPIITVQSLDVTKLESPIPNDLVPIMSRDDYLFEFDGEHQFGEALQVVPQSDQLPPFPWKIVYHYWTSSQLAWDPIDGLPHRVSEVATGLTKSYPNSVQMLARVVSYDKPDAWVRSHPKEALREMLRMGHKEFGDDIGPPYVILHVKLGKGKGGHTIRWITKGVCPGWNENALLNSSLEKWRDAAH